MNGATKNRERPGRRPLTGWELPQLIRPQPLRHRRQGTVSPLQPFYVQLATFFYLHRYATASMAMRFFPELLPTERTAQRHLANMVAHGLLATASTRGTSPNFPFVYFVTRKGIRFLREQLPNGDQLEIPATEERRSRGQSFQSLLHELLVTEFSIMLAQTVRSRGDLRLLTQERRYFHGDRRLTYRDGDKRGWIEPDFGFLPTIDDGGERPRVLPMHFVEMELGTHSVAQLHDKLVAYDRWAMTEGSEYLQKLCSRRTEQQGKGHFRLLLIASDPYGRVGDNRRMLDLFVQAIALPRRMRDRIWLTTATELQAHVHDSAPLAAPIWYRIKDAKRSVDRSRTEYRLRSDKKHHYRVERLAATEELMQQRRHVLFPEPFSQTN